MRSALGSSDSGAKFTCKVTGPDGKSLTSEEAGSVTVYNTVTRTVVKSWNIGAANGTTDYDGSNGTSDVVATLYSDGELAVTGKGDTVVFGTASIGTGYAWAAPWCTDTYNDKVTSSTIESTVGTTDMSYWYYRCHKLTGAPAIPSSVTGMGGTFQNCTALTAAPAIPNDVTIMQDTFYGCTSLTTAPTIPGSVEYMGSTFYGCTALTAAPTIPSNVMNMGSTFSGCTALTAAPTIPSSVKNMYCTFGGCTALTTAPTIPSSVANMDSTFLDCAALTGTMLIKANISNSDDYFNCFNGASTNSTASLKVYGLDTTNESAVKAIVTDTNTHSPSSHITYGGYKVASWNIGSDTAKNNYNGSNGTDKVVATLYSEGELAVTGSGDTVVFDSNAPWTADTYKSQVKTSTIASTVKTTDMSYWYDGCTALTTAPTIPGSVMDMSSTFENCKALTTAPTIPSSVKNMYCTFGGCTALTTAPTIPSSVTDMYCTFSSCIALTGTMLIKATPSNYNGCFVFAATNGGTNLKVNYTSTSESFVDTIISNWGPSGRFSYGNIAKAFTYVDVDDQTASSGTATFTATFSTAPASYQWQKSTDGGKTFADITGATSYELSLTELKTSDNGNIYRCVVKDNSSSAKEAYGEGTLTVTTP